MLPSSYRGDESSILPPHGAPSFYATSAYIRLGHKYQMSRLVDIAVDHLKTFYTSDASKYNLVRGEHDFWGVSAIHVVTIARLIEDDFLLPVALLECCILNEEIMDGFVREDGSVEHFSRDDFKLCFKARATLTRTSTQAYLEVFRSARSSGCKDLSECRRALTKCLENGARHIDVATRTDFGDAVSSIKHRLCPSSFDMVLNRAEVAQKNFWRQLPELLEITVDGWPDESRNLKSSGQSTM